VDTHGEPVTLLLLLLLVVVVLWMVMTVWMSDE